MERLKYKMERNITFCGFLSVLLTCQQLLCIIKENGNPTFAKGNGNGN